MGVQPQDSPLTVGDFSVGPNLEDGFHFVSVPRDLTAPRDSAGGMKWPLALAEPARSRALCWGACACCFS